MGLHVTVLNNINILAIKGVPLKSKIKENDFCLSITTSLQETLATVRHLAEGQFLLEEPILNVENLTYAVYEFEDYHIRKRKDIIWNQ
jgi:hypothetical protein